MYVCACGRGVGAGTVRKEVGNWGGGGVRACSCFVDSSCDSSVAPLFVRMCLDQWSRLFSPLHTPPLHTRARAGRSLVRVRAHVLRLWPCFACDRKLPTPCTLHPRTLARAGRSLARSASAWLQQSQQKRRGWRLHLQPSALALALGRLHLCLCLRLCLAMVPPWLQGRAEGRAAATQALQDQDQEQLRGATVRSFDSACFFRVLCLQVQSSLVTTPLGSPDETLQTNNSHTLAPTQMPRLTRSMR
jgi:hypothetical protein